MHESPSLAHFPHGTFRVKVLHANGVSLMMLYYNCLSTGNGDL